MFVSVCSWSALHTIIIFKNSTYKDPCCIMGKVVGIIGCLLIMGLDTIAGVLGIRAEAAQNQVITCVLINQLVRKKNVISS